MLFKIMNRIIMFSTADMLYRLLKVKLSELEKHTKVRKMLKTTRATTHRLYYNTDRIIRTENT